MARLIARLRSLLRPRSRRASGSLSPTQAAVLRRNLRAILCSKQVLNESR